MKINLAEQCEREQRKNGDLSVIKAALAIAFLVVLFALVVAPLAHGAEIDRPANNFFNNKSPKNRFFEEKCKGWFCYETPQKPDAIAQEQAAKTNADENKTLTIKREILPQSFPVLTKTPEQRAAMREAELQFLRSIPYEHLDSLSAEEFRTSYDRVKEIATMRLDPESALAYMRMNKFSTEQSQKFTDVMQVVANENEFIDPTLVTSAYGSKLVENKKAEKKKALFIDNRGRLAIAIFHGGYDSESYRYQIAAVESLQKDYPDAEVVWIDVSQSPDTVHKMGLKTLPETWLAYTKDDGSLIWRRLKGGVATMTEIVDKAIFMYDKTIQNNIFAKENN